MKNKYFTFLSLLLGWFFLFTQANAQITVTSSVTDITCTGDCDGAIDITPSGGSGIYTFLWGNAAITEDISNLCAGSYDVTVTEDLSVPFQWFKQNSNGNHTILIPAGSITVDGAVAQSGDVIGVFYDSLGTLACGGYTVFSTGQTAVGAWAKDAGATYGFATGTPGEVFTWKLYQASTNLEIDLVATYNIGGPFTHDSTFAINGMSGILSLVGANPQQSQTHTATVNDPGAVLPTGVITNASTSGGSDGAIDLSVTGGTGTYSYVWSNSAVTEDITGLTAGTYDVTVTDVNSCTGTASFTVTEPSAVSLSASITDATCYGGSNGAIDLTVTGGTPPYTYDWGGGITSEDLSNLSAGTYNVVVTDAGGGVASGSYTVNQAAEIFVAAAVTDVGCNGGSDGAIDVTVTNGVATIAYSWSNTEVTEDLTGIIAGLYALTITDGDGCIESGSWTVTEPVALSLTLTATDASLNGVSDGSIDLTVSGGTTGYTYLWSNTEITEDISGLAAGTYDVTVTDANSCTATGTAQVNEPAPSGFGATGTSTNASCYGICDGSIDVSVTGGVLPYSYIWSHGANTQDVSGLCAGTYTVTVVDGTGASSGIFDWTYTQTADNHTILIPATGITIDGQPPVSGDYFGAFYNLNGGGLACGGYVPYTGSVTAIAAWGTESGLNNGFAASEVFKWKYFRVADGTEIDLTPTYSPPGPGGVVNDSTYTPQGVSQITSFIGISTPPAAAQTDTLTFTITEPTEIVLSGVVTDVTCNLDTDGAVDLSVSGGSSPYTFAWDNSEITEDLTGLAAGTYIVVVTDDIGCTSTMSFIVTEPDAISITGNINFVSCYGLADGAIDVSVSGGTPPYTYAWSNSEITEDLSGLAAGTYTVIVTDNAGCTASNSFTVVEPNELLATAAVTNLLCNNDNSGAIDLSVSGGTLPYTFAWDNSEVTEDLTGLAAGTYNVVVTDDNGCSVSGSYTVTEPTALALSEVIVDVLCNGDLTGSIDITVTGGVAPYTYAWDNSEITEDLAGIAAGTYNVVVSDANGCTIAGSYTVTEPTALAISEVIVDVLCNGDFTGAIDLTVSGGVAPYTFAWDNSEVSEDLTGLAAGTYNVVVTDDNGCTIAGSYTVTEPTVLAVSEVIVDVLCNGNLTGSIDITVTGGVAPYTYAWDNSEVSEDLAGITAGTYNVLITDDNGCTIAGSYTVTEPTALALSEVIDNVLCNGDLNGAIDITVSGGVSPYIYAWDNSEVTEDLTGLAAGNYNVIVTDANGCTIAGSYTVTEPAILALSGNITDILCNGALTGAIDITVTGGTMPYTYTWNNSEVTEDLTGIATGTYNVLITDANGCTITGIYTLTEPVALSLTSTITNVSVLWGSDGAIDIEVAGGILPYSYAWSNSAVSEDLLNIIAGVYTVTVTDDNGCLLIESFEINQPPDNPGWTYTNTGINHTILIPSTATLVVEGAPLIPGDYIGVFYDSLGTLACGGLIEYTGLTTALPAWGVQALNDGFVTGEEFTWKIWKAIENMEYEVNAIYMPIGSPQITHEQYFAPNGQSGITALEDVEARQEIELMAGWNIISSYVIEEYMALDSLFADIVSNVGLMKDENGQAYWPGYGVNLIGNWVSEEGYRIYMLDIDTLKLAGEEVDPTTTAINLPFGWSYIGYILDAPGDPAVMLNSVISNIDLLKDENGHVYWPIFGFNSIGNMMPDEGFAIFANAATSFFYPVTPVSGTKSFNADIESKHYGTAFNTGNNMTLGIPVSAWETVPAYGDEVSVFSASGQLVGSAVFANTLMAITVWGDNDQTPTIDGLTDNESLIVKIWNQSERTEQILNIDWVQGSPNYETDDIAIAGKVSIIESFTNSLGQNMPNPVNTLSEIEYSLAKDANVEISVYNILGDKLEVIVSKSQSAGTYKVQFDASNYAAGTYFYKLRAGDFSAIKKMNIVR